MPRKPLKPPAAGPSRAVTPASTAPLGDTPGSDLISVLDQIARDPDTNPQARTQAARAVLEARGVLGKHAKGPDGGAASQPLSNLTRAELEAELARLRLRFAASPS